jgi:hypothetical protein
MKGALAYCSRGELGLITSHAPMPVDYTPAPECICASDGDYHHCTWCPVCGGTHDPANHGVAWLGVHLSKDKLGQPWSSRNPKIIGVPHFGDVKPEDMGIVVEYIRRLVAANQ